MFSVILKTKISKGAGLKKRSKWAILDVMKKNLSKAGKTPPVVSMPSRKKIGLALGGGGAKGLAHIGVIKILEENKIPIDFISGTSMGALVGGWYAATKDILFLENLFLRVRHKDILPTRKIRKNKDGVIFRDKSIPELIEMGLEGKKVEGCQIPFKAVATDVQSGEEVDLGKGSLEEAIKASSALPFIFNPVKFGSRILNDGVFVNPVPADVVKAMGADFVIAVDVSSRWADISEESVRMANLPALITEAISVAQHQIARPKLAVADIVLNPAVLSFHTLEFDSAKEIIFEGELEAKRKIWEIGKKSGYGIAGAEKKPMRKIWEIIYGN